MSNDPDDDQTVETTPSGTPDFQTRVYNEFRALAAAQMSSERADYTLQPTALVHEAWLRLEGSEVANPQDRASFFRTAAESMRRILIEHARGKKRLKRGGGRERMPMKLGDLVADDVASKRHSQSGQLGRVVRGDLDRP